MTDQITGHRAGKSKTKSFCMQLCMAISIISSNNNVIPNSVK